jgi:hypothetical protein
MPAELILCQAAKRAAVSRNCSFLLKHRTMKSFFTQLQPKIRNLDLRIVHMKASLFGESQNLCAYPWGYITSDVNIQISLSAFPWHRLTDITARTGGHNKVLQAAS